MFCICNPRPEGCGNCSFQKNEVLAKTPVRVLNPDRGKNKHPQTVKQNCITGWGCFVHLKMNNLF
jgi:hypothetical protein